jgi:hypothetical protein
MKKILTMAGGWMMAAAAVHAAPVSFVGTGTQQATYFAGTVQQSVITLSNGGSFPVAPASLDLTLGVPLTLWTHEFAMQVGANDGIYNPIKETHTFTGSFVIGGQKVSFAEDFTFYQIANNQFQFEVAASAPGTVFVPGLGQVSIQLPRVTGQLQGNTAGGGQLIATTFTLTSAVPEPASALSLLLGLGFLPLAVRASRRT